jgi:hypothetical protein
MRTRADVANRVVLLLLGLLLVVAGGLGLALSAGAFQDWRARSPVLPDQLHTFPDEQPWFWWAVAGAALLLALLALWWLASQLRTNRVSRIDRTTSAPEGYTTLHARALANAVEDEADGIDGVTSATARLHDRPRLGLDLTVGLTNTPDIDKLRAQLEDDVVAHVRQAVDDPDFPVEIELRPDVRRTPSRTVI